MAEAYCVKDKKKVEVQNAQRITMKNGKPALQGTCPICGNKVFKIGGCPAPSSPRVGYGPRREAGAVPCLDILVSARSRLAAKGAVRAQGHPC